MPNKNKNILLLEKLEHLLQGHDWYYNMSDDHRYYTSGRAEYDRIRETMEECNNNNLGTMATELFRRYNPSYNEQ